MRRSSSLIAAACLAAPVAAQDFYTEPHVFQNTFRELCLLRDFNPSLDPIMVGVRGWSESADKPEFDNEYAFEHPDGLSLEWAPETESGAFCALSINADLLNDTAFDELLALLTDEYHDWADEEYPVDADQGWVWNLTDPVSGKDLHAVLGRREDGDVYYYTIVSGE